MAEEHQWILGALDGILPEQALHFLSDHVLARETPFQNILRTLQALFRNVVAILYPILQPILVRVGTMLSDSPDVVFVFSLVAIFFAVLQTLLWVHRVMMFWTRLVGRLMLWACVAAVLAMAWQRGPEAVIRDAVVFVSKVAGYASLVKDIWLAEYNKYDAQTKNSGRKVGGTGSRRRGGR
ncbi:hypothetical protein BKA67DRAFT_548542 [Truncatella angustata]|uniref:Uncharacterized protein n=1 Tax=Truncatella angustata TaxID=152316 RepID=A0A9P8UZ66_9PEZI|nr:uncharacterized protein BKA67DRAFT_548542 [Truncatella angustata]KAH6660584.1 hypothetical protein BKA67DRAFT_548542 [Truncatella angustata]KAH8203607.1 hypothetical protein TruAng_002240 [Truncatella angustata]